jgi:hypothetical protein
VAHPDPEREMNPLRVENLTPAGLELTSDA